MLLYYIDTGEEENSLVSASCSQPVAIPFISFHFNSINQIRSIVFLCQGLFSFHSQYFLPRCGNCRSPKHTHVRSLYFFGQSRQSICRRCHACMHLSTTSVLLDGRDILPSTSHWRLGVGTGSCARQEATRRCLQRDRHRHSFRTHGRRRRG